MQMTAIKPFQDFPSTTPTEEYFEFKTKIHNRLLDVLDFSLIDKLDSQALKPRIRNLLEKILRENLDTFPLNLSEREMILTELEDEVLGLGPLEPLLKDPTISDILVNTYNKVYVERFGDWKPRIQGSRTMLTC